VVDDIERVGDDISMTCDCACLQIVRSTFKRLFLPSFRIQLFIELVRLNWLMELVITFGKNNRLTSRAVFHPDGER
jgi:hypothetical protein